MLLMPSHNPCTFLSTLSLRRATLTRSTLPAATWYFYPRSPCGERPVHYIYLFCLVCISIHALLAESDRSAKSFFCGILVISIHALLAESDWMPARQRQTLRYFYPRSPCGERLYAAALCHAAAGISIHALLAESDLPPTTLAPSSSYFYPRSPCGERRGRQTPWTYQDDFYPRSPCGERLWAAKSQKMA